MTLLVAPGEFIDRSQRIRVASPISRPAFAISEAPTPRTLVRRRCTRQRPNRCCHVPRRRSRSPTRRDGRPPEGRRKPAASHDPACGCLNAADRTTEPSQLLARLRVGYCVRPAQPSATACVLPRRSPARRSARRVRPLCAARGDCERESLGARLRPREPRHREPLARPTVAFCAMSLLGRVRPRCRLPLLTRSIGMIEVATRSTLLPCRVRPLGESL